jgi:hypothetical protein
MQMQLQKFSLLDAQHLVAMSWKRVSGKSIENYFRKGGFFKANAKIPAFEKSDLTSVIFDQAPDGMPKKESENWLDIDNNADVVATMTVSEICQVLPMISPNLQNKVNVIFQIKKKKF